MGMGMVVRLRAIPGEIMVMLMMFIVYVGVGAQIEQTGQQQGRQLARQQLDQRSAAAEQGGGEGGPDDRA